MERNKYKIALVSLGCDKNRIDSEIMLGILKGKHKIVEDPMDADIIIVNTCGFIDAAKEESINTILEMAQFKNQGNCKLLMATGCLTQRYGEELMREMPELDVILGVNSYNNLNHYIEKFIENEEKIIDIEYSDLNINDGTRQVTTSFGVSAYLRIGEGCSKNCTYCIIPKIRGKYRSRKKEEIIEEAKKLKENGVSELIVIAQDTTMYGVDIYGEKKLHELLEELQKLNFKWIRVMYMYPEAIYDSLLDTISKYQNILNYFDMPIQQVSDNILKKMGRRTTRKDLLNTIDKIRKKMPDAIIRTSLIVGFPGETDKDFNELLDFLKEYRLDKVGAFTYSKEEGTAAFHMENQIDEEVKEDRRNNLMELQQGISFDINKNKVGNTYEVLIESFDGENYIGRSWEMAPEIDGNVLINSKKELLLGDFKKVKIVDFEEYDLIGELV